MVDKNINLEKIDIHSLVPADYNPRKISDKDYINLKNSIDEFGVVSPIIINLNDFTIISGHQRFDVLYYENNISELFLLRLGDIGWVFTETDLTIKDKNYEKTLNLALNRIHGDFDPDKLDTVLSDLQELKLDSLTGFDLELDNIDYDFISRIEDESIDDAEIIEDEIYDDDEDEIIENIDEIYDEEVEETPVIEKEKPKNRIKRGFIKYGDVYKIGDSYLMFGKTDNEQDRTKLLSNNPVKSSDEFVEKFDKIKTITKEINYYMCDDAEIIENIIIEHNDKCKKIS